MANIFLYNFTKFKINIFELISKQKVNYGQFGSDTLHNLGNNMTDMLCYQIYCTEPSHRRIVYRSFGKVTKTIILASQTSTKAK